MQRIIADLHVQNPADKETQLTLALQAAIKAAKAEKTCGLLVTRHHYSQSPYLRQCHMGRRMN